MKILIIPDSFKGSLLANEVAAAIEQGIKSVLPQADCCSIGLADGGEGSLDLWLAITKAEDVSLEVSNAYGHQISARYGYNPVNNVAFIEVAQASGLEGINAHELNPMVASSIGTGQLIKHALSRHTNTIILAMGGTATIDGGTGLLQGMGCKFTKKWGYVLQPGTNPLIDFEQVELEIIPELQKVNWLLLADVTNPLIGDYGAAKVFGPQKGANVSMIEMLDIRLNDWMDFLVGQGGRDVRGNVGAGAAGGMGVPFLSFCNSMVRSGFDWFSEALDLRSLISQSDVVITGEGMIDNQTKMGKGPGKIALLAREAHKPVIAITGKNKGESDLFDVVFQLTNDLVDTDMAIRNAKELLIKVGADCGRFIGG